MDEELLRRKQLMSFWESVNLPEGCWEWNGYFSAGYGQIRWDGRYQSTHRISWELFHGPIPEGLQVCHKCDNPKCVNPHHLFLGTNADNAHDRDAKGRTAKGETHGKNRPDNRKTVMTNEKVIEIRRLFSTTSLSQEDLAQRFGVTQGNISAIILRKTWKHIP